MSTNLMIAQYFICFLGNVIEIAVLLKFLQKNEKYTKHLTML